VGESRVWIEIRYAAIAGVIIVVGAVGRSGIEIGKIAAFFLKEEGQWLTLILVRCTETCFQCLEAVTRQLAADIGTQSQLLEMIKAQVSFVQTSVAITGQTIFKRVTVIV